MTQYVLTYLIGTLLGELLLLGWWGMQQPRPVTPDVYFKKRWAQALFSGVFAIGGCMWWAEGGGVNLFGQGHVTLTVGWSVLMGMTICFFAHSLVWGVGSTKLGTMLGLKPPQYVIEAVEEAQAQTEKEEKP